MTELAVDVIVIGGGFSGLSTILHLQRHRAETRVAWIRGDTPGFGPAYRTTDDSHLLNVRAERMSAWSEFADDFVHWLHGHHPGLYAASDFVPRKLYARYLGDLERTLGDNVQQFHQQADAASFDTQWRVRIKSGATVRAPHCVLATGNPPIRDPGWAKSARVIEDFWQWRLADDWQMPALSADENVVIVGSGLSAVDAALSLLGAGFQGAILMISPSGKLPQQNRHAMPSSETELLPTLRADSRAAAWLHAMRSCAREHDWRALIDNVRCHSSELWRALNVAEQRRFMRHVWSVWNHHRHRVAPEVHARLHAHSRFSVAAGRVRSVAADGAVTWRARHADRDAVIAAGLVINCMGPAYARGLKDSDLLRGLIDAQRLSVHPLGLGVDVPRTRGLHAIGALLLGEYLETTAVPELRQQAHAIAVRIVADLRGH